MENNSPDVLTESFLKEAIIPRSKLLPSWIRVFAWGFLFFGLLIPIIISVSIITHNFAASLYGIESNTIYSLAGIIIVILFSLKTIVAIGLIKFKDWAVKLGIADAIFGILICCGMMVYGYFNANQVVMRLELIALIPYLIKLLKIKADWELSSGI